jgi:hypothetical protein
MPENKDEYPLSGECDDHLKAVGKRRAKLLEDRRREAVRQLREVQRDELELDGRRASEWQVQLDAERKIRTEEQPPAADD